MGNVEQKRNVKKIIFWSAMSAISAIGIFIVIYAIKGIFPFGEGTLLRNDAIYQYNPLLVEFSERLREGSSILFSWQSGFGVNFFGTFLYYLVNPFNLIAVFFKAENMHIAFSLIVILSMATIAAATAIYLQKHFHEGNIGTIIFSLCYTFCGFFVANYYNTMWLMAFAMLPLIALGIEKIAKGKSPYLYCISLSFAIISNFYLGFMLCIFSLLYFFICLFSNPVNKKGEDREKKETLFPVIFKFGLFSVLSGGVSAITLIPIMYSLGNSYVKNIFTSEGSFFFNLFDFFKAHLSGIINNQMVMTESTIPAVAVCTIILVLLPLYFFAKSIKLNEKLSFAALVLIFVASFEIPTIYYLWHGMSAPAGLPYRFAFMYSFILVVMAYKAFIHIKEIPKWAILVPITLLIALYTFALIDTDKVLSMNLIVGAIMSAVFITIVIFIQNVNKGKRAVQAVALVCLFVEIVAVNNRYILNAFNEDQYKIYGESANEVQAIIDAQDNNFYRMEFNNFENTFVNNSDKSSFGMTASLYGYNGVSQFSSLSDWKYSMLQFNLGNSGNLGNAYGYSMQTPIYNSLFGIKYVMDTYGNIHNSKYFTKVADDEKIAVYKTSDDIGLGYMINDGINSNGTFNQNPFLVQNSVWKDITGVNDALSNINIDNVDYVGCHEVSFTDAKNDFSGGQNIHNHSGDETAEEHAEQSANIFDLMEVAGGAHLYKLDNENDFSVTFTIAPTKDQYVYASVNSGSLEKITVIDGEKDFEYLVDNKQIVGLGYRRAGEKIKIKATAVDCTSTYQDIHSDRTHDDAIYFTAAGLNDDAFDAGIKNIRENGVFNLTEFNETDLKGTVNAKNDGYMMMSMVYDKGWSVFVDGQKIELHENESNIMMFPVSKGEHQIEMKYFPQGLKEGLFVSAGSILALFLSVLVIKMRKERFIAEQDDAQTNKKDDGDNSKK